MKFENMNAEQRIEYLVERCKKHKVFSMSVPEFDAEFFLKCAKIADVHVLRELLNDMHTYFEINPENIKRYKNFREHYRKLLVRRIKAMKYHEAKKTKKAKEASRPKIKQCPDCGRTYGVHFHIMVDGRCNDCFIKNS